MCRLVLSHPFPSIMGVILHKRMGFERCMYTLNHCILFLTLQELKNCVAVQAKSTRVANFKKRELLFPMFFMLLSVWNSLSGRCNMML